MCVSLFGASHGVGDRPGDHRALGRDAVAAAEAVGTCGQGAKPQPGLIDLLRVGPLFGRAIQDPRWLLGQGRWQR